jgi:hypothetical protein
LHPRHGLLDVFAARLHLRNSGLANLSIGDGEPISIPEPGISTGLTKPPRLDSIGESLSRDNLNRMVDELLFEEFDGDMEAVAPNAARRSWPHSLALAPNRQAATGELKKSIGLNPVGLAGQGSVTGLGATSNASSTLS